MIDVRASRSDKRLNRARVELEASRSVRPAIVVVLGLALGLGLALFILHRVNPNALTSTYEARFAVSDVTAVQDGINQVKFKGVPIGKIDKIEVDGDQPVLKVTIRKQYGRIFQDARAELRPNTALQDMYLDIVSRGTKDAGVADPDKPLAASQTKLPVNVSDVLNVFAPSQRLRMSTLLDELGNGTQDQGKALRQTFVALVPLVQNAGIITQQLARRGPQVRRLVHNTAVLTRELGERETSLRTLLHEGSLTLGTLQAGSGDLDATLRELPPTMDAIQTSFAATRGILPDVDGAVRSLTPVAGQLPDALDDVQRLSTDLRPTVAALRRPVARLVPLARTVQPLAADLDRLTAALAPQVGTINKVTDVLAECKDGVQHFFQWNASIAKFGDARGPVPRGNVVFGAQSSSLLNDPGEVAPQACSPGKIIGGRLPRPEDKH